MRWTLVLLIGLVMRAEGQEFPSSLTLYGTFTTTSKLFRNASAPDEIVRNQFLPLDGVYSIGVDFRRSIEPLRIKVGLSVEYLAKSDTYILSSGTSAGDVPVRDGYTVLPFELSGYFPIPVGTRTLQFYMGGGGGVYVGTRQYDYAGASAVTIERTVGYGIHILSGAEIGLSSRYSLRTEVKFRDIQFQTVNRFTEYSTLFEGRIVPLDQDPQSSRISIDGMTLNLGIAYHF